MNEYEVQEQEVFEWHGFAKVWLWIGFIANIVIAVSYIGNLVIGNMVPLIVILGVWSSSVNAIGFASLLFKKKKLGFFLVIGGAVISIVMNAIGGSAVMGIVSAFVGLLILFLAIRKDMDKLE